MWPFKPKKDRIFLDLLELPDSSYAIRKTTIYPNNNIGFEYLNLSVYRNNPFDIYFRDVFHSFLHSLKCSRQEAQTLLDTLSCRTGGNTCNNPIKTIKTNTIQ